MTPKPMKDIRIKSEFTHHKEIEGAIGLKIFAKDLEGALAGSTLYVYKNDIDAKEIVEEVVQPTIDEDTAIKFLAEKKGMSVDEFKDSLIPKEKEVLDPETEAYLKYRKETGRGYSDFQQTQKEWDKEPQENVLRHILKMKYPDLDADEIEFKFKKQYSYDPEYDDDDAASRFELDLQPRAVGAQDADAVHGARVDVRRIRRRELAAAVAADGALARARGVRRDAEGAGAPRPHVPGAHQAPRKYRTPLALRLVHRRAHLQMAESLARHQRRRPEDGRSPDPGAPRDTGRRPLDQR